MRFFYRLEAERWFFVMVGMFLLAISVSCKGVQPAMTPAQMVTGPVPNLTLGPGDVIDFKFFYTPELNDSQTVRADGKITLQLVGEVMVQGKTPDEFRKELVKLYTPELKNPEIAVIVRTLYDNRIYVGGEVKTPGLIPMMGRLTVLEAIMQAGGFDRKTAEMKNVVVIRHINGNRYGCAIDLTDVLKGKEVKEFYLEPHDIVYVPPTVIVKVDQWIDQYINRIIPRTGFTASYPVGSGIMGVDTSTAILPSP